MAVSQFYIHKLYGRTGAFLLVAEVTSYNLSLYKEISFTLKAMVDTVYILLQLSPEAFQAPVVQKRFCLSPFHVV